MRATPPSSAELQAAAGMLGDVVDATGEPLALAGLFCYWACGWHAGRGGGCRG